MTLFQKDYFTRLLQRAKRESERDIIATLGFEDANATFVGEDEDGVRFAYVRIKGNPERQRAYPSPNLNNAVLQSHNAEVILTYEDGRYWIKGVSERENARALTEKKFAPEIQKVTLTGLGSSAPFTNSSSYENIGLTAITYRNPGVRIMFSLSCEVTEDGGQSGWVRFRLYGFGTGGDQVLSTSRRFNLNAYGKTPVTWAGPSVLPASTSFNTIQLRWRVGTPNVTNPTALILLADEPYLEVMELV